MSNIIDESKAQMRRMDVILGDAHLDTRRERCSLMNVIVLNLEHAEVWKGHAQLTKKLEAVQMTAANSIPGYLKSMSDTALRPESGWCPFEASRELRILKWQYRVRNTQINRLPAIVGSAIWRK